MFIDKVKITVKAGNGGNGAVAFHREKYVAAGGPDGGDGGKGGNIVLRVNDNLSTLMDFRYKRKYAAAPGQDGQGARCSGKRGEDLVIQVPRGTVVRDAATNEIIKDMSDDADFILCKGGRGGWGNKHFATPTRQVPRFAKAGLPGEEHEVVLELKLLADVGLVGFPNVGKSTLLSVTSNARPKIANYHFTTLYPNLGVIYVDEGVSFVMADIPGIIEGAAEGAGLGHDFLRHIDRCRLLVHLVDVSGSEGRDPIEDFEKINAELRDYSPELAERPMIVAANKCDLIPEGSDNLERLRAYVTERGYPFYEISAATTQGTKQLMRVIAGRLRELPPVTVYEPEYVKPLAEAGEVPGRLLDDLGIQKRWLSRYPHELSGGMCQRVMIAMAMSCEPKLLIADEPTTALDVTIQAQILALMEDIRNKRNTGILMITHDLGVVAETCSRVIVMYAGNIVEEAPVRELFANPQHPYTQGLIESVPKLGSRVHRLPSIPGSVPDLAAMPSGCRFAPRCKYAQPSCSEKLPDLVQVGENHRCACPFHTNARKGA